MQSEDVARYYDRNTRRFLFMGSGGGVRSIHRELWGPGVRSAREAGGHIDRVLADEIAGLVTDPAPVLVDFGCGVGGTLFHLAERFPEARLSGITISGRQAELAKRFAEQSGLADRCSFSLGDFQTADLGLLADVIVAVESFVHSDSMAAFLANAAKHLRPQGYLIVVDDFLAADVDSLNARQRLSIRQFQEGWRVPSVCTAESLVEAAGGQGLEAMRTEDLTSLTRPGSRARDHLTAMLAPTLARMGLGRIPFCGNLIGGNALQIGLRGGFLRYQLLVFRKRA